MEAAQKATSARRNRHTNTKTCFYLLSLFVSGHKVENRRVNGNHNDSILFTFSFRLLLFRCVVRTQNHLDLDDAINAYHAIFIFGIPFQEICLRQNRAQAF